MFRRQNKKEKKKWHKETEILKYYQILQFAPFAPCLFHHPLLFFSSTTSFMEAYMTFMCMF